MMHVVVLLLTKGCTGHNEQKEKCSSFWSHGEMTCLSACLLNMMTSLKKFLLRYIPVITFSFIGRKEVTLNRML